MSVEIMITLNITARTVCILDIKEDKDGESFKKKLHIHTNSYKLLANKYHTYEMSNVNVYTGLPCYSIT